ncbi:hypothetical protein ROZALSC1DRAFT_27893 [Rozella allomycis CSF55]|uniref:Hly-III-related domain-containing protein n=1 Tax=Rozella allomycis (strain CSF55) TaxID=988480 RepID=A0A075AYC2_ROZAC|nr:Hly-III-related domain-containing protein [Rozella allomycis CSF55]RKP20640.1 hypothetical protein ROZALSC1DRAFT_27893 [Rozella allomycis CSF55]|eukprot:EPZ35277.1 Hly-III-related domain-containing protein [Rozella allomycis CSF55]
MQRLDHASIFIFIAATYTPICLLTLGEHEFAMPLLRNTWIIAFFGILKIFLTNESYPIIDICLYLLCGWMLAPHLNLIISHITFADTLLFLLGGMSYSIGACIFGLEKPNLMPPFFEYHELFHVLTIIGHLCFYFPILNAIQNNSK